MGGDARDSSFPQFLSLGSPGLVDDGDDSTQILKSKEGDYQSGEVSLGNETRTSEVKVTGYSRERKTPTTTPWIC